MSRKRLPDKRKRETWLEMKITSWCPLGGRDCAIYFEKLSERDGGKTTDPAVHEYKIRGIYCIFRDDANAVSNDRNT